MRTVLSATAAFVLLATAALADEVPPPQPNAQRADDSAKQAEDCSKQVWPHFSQLAFGSKARELPSGS